MNDEDYRRYVRINLPHARTIVQRLGRHLDRLASGRAGQNGDGVPLHDAFTELERALRDYDEDPPSAEALAVADAVAEHGRALVQHIIAAELRDDRLGQAVRNLFECLGLADEGAALALQCGERPDSLMR